MKLNPIELQRMAELYGMAVEALLPGGKQVPGKTSSASWSRALLTGLFYSPSPSPPSPPFNPAFLA
jgi:hypothetical protein